MRLATAENKEIAKLFTAFVHLSILHVTPIPDGLTIPCNRLVRIVKYMLHDGCSIV